MRLKIFQIPKRKPKKLRGSKFEPNRHDIQAFADDIVTYIEKTKRKKLSNSLNLVLKVLSKWANKWKIEFSKEKTKVVVFSRLRNTNYDTIYFEGRELEVTREYKYLGIWFDNKLTWRKHLKEACSRMRDIIIKLGAVCRTKWGLPPEATKFLYERAILPIVQYGAIVWGPVLQYRYAEKDLQKVQRLAGLSITGALRTTSNEALNILAGLIPLHYALKERIAVQFYNLQKKREVRERLNWVQANLNLENTKYKSSLEYAEECFALSEIRISDIHDEVPFIHDSHPLIYP